MKLYEFAPTRSIRARWTLQELEVPFESVTVNLAAGEHRKPGFMKLNPAARVPVLVDGDLVLTESVAIVLYLGEKYADKGFVPGGLKERAEMYRWLMFAATELEQPLWRIARNSFLYPAEQRLSADIAIASREFRAMAEVVEQHMQGREFVVGNQASIADFVLAYTLDWGSMVQLLDHCPVLNAYLERMYARPRAAMRIAQARASIAA